MSDHDRASTGWAGNPVVGCPVCHVGIVLRSKLEKVELHNSWLYCNWCRRQLQEQFEKLFGEQRKG